MTLEQLEQRVAKLERELEELRREVKPIQPLRSISETYGMFKDDPLFDEIVRLGREYRYRDETEGD